MYFATRPATPARASTSRRPGASPSTASRRSPTCGPATSRCYEDGRWRTDGSADLGRISRQQDFIVRALRPGGRPGRAQPGHARPAGRTPASTRSRSTTCSPPTTSSTWRRAFRGFDPGSLDLVLPARSCRAASGGASILRLRRRARPSRPSTGSAAPTPSDLRPADVRVRVLNGSGITGQAGQAGDALDRGRASAPPAPARPSASTSPRPLVRYTAGGEAKADLVARYLDPSAAPRAGRRARSRPTSSWSPGSHYAGVRTTPRPRRPVDDDAPPRRRDHHDHARRRRRPSSSTTSTTVGGLRARGAAGGRLLTLGRLRATCQTCPAMDASRRSVAAIARPEAAR